MIYINDKILIYLFLVLYLLKWRSL